MPITPQEARERLEAAELSMLSDARRSIDDQLAVGRRKGWIEVKLSYAFKTAYLEVLKDNYRSKGWVVKSQVGGHTLLHFRERTWWDRLLDHFR